MRFNSIARSALVPQLAVYILGSFFVMTSVTQFAAGQVPKTSKTTTLAKTVWEYDVPSIIYNSSDLERRLNELGADGWELAHIEDGFPAIFKRPKQTRPDIPAADSTEPSGVEDLQEKRIGLLAKRVSEMKKLLDSAHVDLSVFTRAEIELIEAKLTYSRLNREKLTHLRELLKKYDLLIEFAEFRTEEPPERRLPTAKTELLWLQSERVRIELLIAALDG